MAYFNYNYGSYLFTHSCAIWPLLPGTFPSPHYNYNSHTVVSAQYQGTLQAMIKQVVCGVTTRWWWREWNHHTLPQLRRRLAHTTLHAARYGRLYKPDPYKKDIYYIARSPQNQFVTAILTDSLFHTFIIDFYIFVFTSRLHKLRCVNRLNMVE